jgi:hypothetical protein
MRLRNWVLVAAILGGAFAPSLAGALSLDDKTNLQAAMQRHLDRGSVDGVYLYLDPSAGTARGLHPVTAHPMILQMGENFVLCYDFRDNAGKDVEVDFYMARKDTSFVVFHSAVGDREMLHQLMKAGKVTRAE